MKQLDALCNDPRHSLNVEIEASLNGPKHVRITAKDGTLMHACSHDALGRNDAQEHEWSFDRATCKRCGMHSSDVGEKCPGERRSLDAQPAQPTGETTLELIRAYQTVMRGEGSVVIRGRLGFPDVEVRPCRPEAQPLDLQARARDLMTMIATRHGHTLSDYDTSVILASLTDAYRAGEQHRPDAQPVGPSAYRHEAAADAWLAENDTQNAPGVARETLLNLLSHVWCEAIDHARYEARRRPEVRELPKSKPHHPDCATFAEPPRGCSFATAVADEMRAAIDDPEKDRPLRRWWRMLMGYCGDCGGEGSGAHVCAPEADPGRAAAQSGGGT